MIRITNKKDWTLFRIVIPVFPRVNIFTRPAKVTTALGPIMVATAANKLWGWRVEVIDENNYNGPRNKQGLPDHSVLQEENPATVVGFYCGLSSTIERVWELAEFYRQKKALTIAGGWHAHYCPEETLNHNIDMVVHGDGEVIIQRVLNALEQGKPLRAIPGISFLVDLENREVRTNSPKTFEIPDLNDLPYPDFGLLRHAKIKIYPIGRVKGCRMNCEFCSVKGCPRWASARHLYDTVNWLVETRGAKKFFIVDDRLEEDLDGTLEFFKMISEKYGNQLTFMVQIRLGVAENTELLRVMSKAGVRFVYIGYESPIDEDLKAMRKGYLSSHMIEWTRILRQYFWVHGMFIFGYPLKEKTKPISAQEKYRRFRTFIRKARLDSIQIFLPILFVGTDLRQRLEKERRVFPLEVASWNKYDGGFVLFEPDGMSFQELQRIPIKIMRWFYNPLSFVRIFLRTIIFPIDYFIRGWKSWYRGWNRDVIKYGGHLLVGQWRKREESAEFLKKLEKYRKE